MTAGLAVVASLVLPLDRSPHTVTMVEVERGVELEVLDWGGRGQALVLLTGLGDNAHVYDRLALRFSDRFHVVGVTRRGFGRSTHPADGYDAGTLARDVLAIADHFRLGRVVLVGHSIAGSEMTQFASSYPDRVLALVYLDAAYDFTKRPSVWPDQPFTRADGASVAAVNGYLQRTIGVQLPEAAIVEGHVFDAGGRVVRSRTTTAAQDAIYRGVRSPSYEDIRVPVLAIYAPVTRTSVYPDYSALSEENRARADRALIDLQRRQAESMEQFRSRTPEGRIVTLDRANHYVFLTHEDEVVRQTQRLVAEATNQ